MGFYLNFANTPKEKWLEKHGELLPSAPDYHYRDGKVVVCLVDNGPFTAAGIAFDADELEAFNFPKDIRPKKWYLIPIEKALERHPSLKNVMPELKGA